MRKENRSVEMKPIDESENRFIEGRAIVFNEPTNIVIGNKQFTEIISDKALDNTDMSEAILLYNHNLDLTPLAKNPDTLEFIKDDKGLSIRAELPNTNRANEIYESIRRKDLSGMSFGFTVAEESFDKETNTRTIYEIDKIYEVSIVPFPAYKGTNLEARNNNDFKNLQVRINQILFKGDELLNG